MFIAQGFKNEAKVSNRLLNFFSYIVGAAIVVLASFVGQIPLLIGCVINSSSSNKMPSSETDIYALFESNVLLFLILISFVFALAGLYFVVKKIHHQPFLSIITSRKKIDWKRVFFAFGVWALFSSATIFISYLLDPSKMQWQFDLIPFLILALISVILLPVQTTTEELIFRGYLMQGFFNLSKNKWFPLFMTSILFGTMHIFNPEVEKMGYLILIYYIGTGLFLGIITLMDEGTELALGFHAANNMVAALLITSDYTVFQTHSVFKDVTEPSLNFEAFFPVFVVFPLLILLFAKVYQWKQWKHQLFGTSADMKNQEEFELPVQEQDQLVS